MDNQQIEYMLRDYDYCFKGVYARDELPNRPIRDRPCAVIMNTDTGDQPGQHWVVLLINENNVLEYFDSFGQYPEYEEIWRFKDINRVNNFVYNDTQFQNAMSSTCGLYCVLFVKFRCGGLRFEEFIKFFSSEDTIKNDVKAFVSLLL